MQIKMDITQVTSDQDLFNAARELGIKLDAVTLRTQNPRRYAPGSSSVKNMSDGADGGTHWCALYKLPRRQGKDDCVYCDSFGLPPPEEFVATAKRDKDEMYYNLMQIQDMRSQACGYFCLVFLHHCQTHPAMSAEQLLHSFQQLFSTNPRDNDKMLKNYLNKIQRAQYT